MNEEKLAQYLKLCCKGRANTKRSDEIERAVGLSGNELRKLVNRMRRRGVPSGSSRSRYFYAVTAVEAYSTIRQLRIMANGLEAGIDEGAKLCAYVNEEDNSVTIAQADHKYDLRDVPPEVLDMFLDTGLCLGELDELLIKGEVVYEG